MIRSILGSSKMIIVILSIFIFSTQIYAQGTVKYSGTVIDSDNYPVVGAVVSEKGTNNATITDIDGNFTLVGTKGGSTLIVSFIGMATQEVKGSENMKLTLQTDMIGLDEVIAIGYGTQKKMDIVGSVSAVKGEKMNTAPAPSLTQNMSGKLPGVITSQNSGTPGFEDMNIVIRGKGTKNNSNPLVLVDGVERSWSRIDPNDIASMTVLKDAASTAVYGARAANGVILIITKRGATGKPTIAYSASFGVQEPTKMLDYLNSYDYARYFNEALLNTKDGDSDGLNLFTDEQLEGYKNGTLSDTDWHDITFDNNATVQSHNLSLSGGSENSKYYLSVGYFDQNGLYDISNFNRYNVRLNVDAKINNSISVGADLSTRSEKATRSPNDDDALWLMAENTKPIEPMELPDSLKADGTYAFSGFDGNPWAEANGIGYKKVDVNYVESTFKVDIDIPWVDGLKVTGKYSLDKKYTHDKTFQYGYDVYAYQVGTDQWQFIPDGKDQELTEWKENFERKTSQIAATYESSIGNHSISALALFERENTSQNKMTASRAGFLSKDVDYLFAGNEDKKDNDGTASETAREGYVARVSYNYSSKYYLQANGRYDGSYRFAPGQRFGFFPSASAAWRISEESYMQEISWLDNMKIRSSYGLLGNDNISAFQYLGGYGFDDGRGYTVGGKHNLALAETTAANEGVTWETTATLNFGVDLSVLDGKFSLEADYFNRHTTDMLIKSSGLVPTSAGINLPKVNSGEMEVKGFEILARHRNTIKEIDYSIEGTVTYAKNNVIDIDESDDVLPGRKQEGRPDGTVFGYESLGLFQSQEEVDNWTLDQDQNGNSSIRPGDIKYRDQNNDNKLDVNDIVPIAYTGFPELTYGINIYGGYKGFGLTLNFQGATKMDRAVILDRPFKQDVNVISEVVENSWRPDNTGAKYPRLYSGGATNNMNSTNQSDFWYRSGSYCRLKNAQLDYTFDSKLLKSYSIESLKLYVAGTNLLTFSKTKYEDPEVKNTKSHLGIAPIMSSYTFGLNVSF